MIASGLTLPLHETDPSLSGPAAELQRGRERLLDNETLTDEEAGLLAAALRAGAADPAGRPCDRVVLDRTDLSSPWQETLFSTRIGLITLDPRLRRVLGFGYADRTAEPGQSYDYLVSGTFDAADLADEIYDVHQIPSGTALPATFRIRDAVFRFGAPTTVVLDPPPDPAALTAVSRRGLPLSPGDPVDGFVSWWTAGLSCVVDLPRPVTRVVLEVPPEHTLFCAGALGSGPAGASMAVPAGPSALMTFIAPADQLRIRGTGTLYAVRLPQGSAGPVVLRRPLGPVQLTAVPLPGAPVGVTAENLQTPPTVINGDIGEHTTVPARPQPGFRIGWVPSMVGAQIGSGIGWPGDLAAGPPIDAVAFVIQHRRVEGGGSDPWEAIQAGDNLTFGSWPPAPRRIAATASTSTPRSRCTANARRATPS